MHVYYCKKGKEQRDYKTQELSVSNQPGLWSWEREFLCQREGSWTHTTISTNFPTVAQAHCQATPPKKKSGHPTVYLTFSQSQHTLFSPLPAMLATSALTAPSPSTHSQSVLATANLDQGDPLVVLKDCGITSSNKGDLCALVNVLKQIKTGRTHSIGRDRAQQLSAVTALLKEIADHVDSPPSARPATCEDLQWAIEDIKSSMASQSLPMSYAAAAKGPMSQNHLMPPRPAISTKTRE